MLRIALCDDCPDFIDDMNNMLEKWKCKSNTFLYQSFDNGDDLISAHNSAPFDIIFLDVIMPMLDGIETARSIRQNDKTVKIVFLTSSPEFAVDSYTVKANNYLLKPVNPIAFYNCLEELSSEISQNTPTITVKGLYSIQKVPLDNIEYVEAQNKHIVFYLRNGTTIETTEPLRLLDDKLMIHDGFFRCHRSYIVNINYIDTYSLKEIKLYSGCRVPIARSCQKEFETAYFAVTFGRAGE